jgi:hypothetical protein
MFAGRVTGALVFGSNSTCARRYALVIGPCSTYACMSALVIGSCSTQELVSYGTPDAFGVVSSPLWLMSVPGSRKQRLSDEDCGSVCARERSDAESEAVLSEVAETLIML